MPKMLLDNLIGWLSGNRVKIEKLINQFFFMAYYKKMEIPNEIWMIIMKDLHILDLYACELVCKKLYNVCTDHHFRLDLYKYAYYECCLINRYEQFYDHDILDFSEYLEHSLKKEIICINHDDIRTLMHIKINKIEKLFWGYKDLYDLEEEIMHACKYDKKYFIQFYTKYCLINNLQHLLDKVIYNLLGYYRDRPVVYIFKFYEPSKEFLINIIRDIWKEYYDLYVYIDVYIYYKCYYIYPDLFDKYIELSEDMHLYFDKYIDNYMIGKTFLEENEDYDISQEVYNYYSQFDINKIKNGDVYD